MIVEFDDQAWSLGQLGEFVKECSPVDRPITGRPLAIEEPASSLTALTNRLVAYMEAA